VPDRTCSKRAVQCAIVTRQRLRMVVYQWNCVPHCKFRALFDDARLPLRHSYWNNSSIRILSCIWYTSAQQCVCGLLLIVPDWCYLLIWISNHKISVLFHSPLKVLFSFPSQYLFTIGLWLIFRISRNLPALLNSNLKEFDSLYWKVCHCTCQSNLRDYHPF